MNQKTAPCSGTSPEQGAFLCNYPVVLFLNSSVPSVRAFPFWRILMMEIVSPHAVTSPAFREETLFLPFHPVPPPPLYFAEEDTETTLDFCLPPINYRIQNILLSPHRRNLPRCLQWRSYCLRLAKNLTFNWFICRICN